MGFGYLSGLGGAKLTVQSEGDSAPKTQVDVVGIDDEVALAIECKSSERYSKRTQFQEELGKHALIRQQFGNCISKQFPTQTKRKYVLAMFMSNISLSDNDLTRAQAADVVIFSEQDLLYYENLVGHLGPAAKYQFLADMLPGKVIPGLNIRVPAIKTRVGQFDCYTFAISPEYLLKISYMHISFVRRF
jgi:Holliday junction resolvase